MAPDAAPKVAGERYDAAAQRDDEADRQLRDCLTVHARRPSHADAVTARRVEIDHVEADAGLADDPQLRQRLEQRVIEYFEAGNRFVVPTEEIDERLRRQGRAGF